MSIKSEYNKLLLFDAMKDYTDLKKEDLNGGPLTEIHLNNIADFTNKYNKLQNLFIRVDEVQNLFYQEKGRNIDNVRKLVIPKDGYSEKEFNLIKKLSADRKLTKLIMMIRTKDLFIPVLVKRIIGDVIEVYFNVLINGKSFILNIPLNEINEVVFCTAKNIIGLNAVLVSLNNLEKLHVAPKRLNDLSEL